MNDTKPKIPTIEEVMEYLENKSKVDKVGMNGDEVYVEKQYLHYALIYLQDYMYVSGQI